MIGVELVDVLHAVGVGAEARVVDQFGPADGAEQALGHLLDRGRERRPIGRPCSGRRCAAPMLVERLPVRGFTLPVRR